MSVENVVYIAQAVDGGPVKIGTTRADRLKQRLSELQTGNPSQLRYVRLFRGGKSLESKLHKVYELQRVSPKNEWFIVNDAIQKLIDDGAEWLEAPLEEMAASVFDDVGWQCDRCGEKINPKPGFIGISEHDAYQAMLATQRWEIECREKARERGLKWFNPVDFSTMPLPAQWIALHDECLDPDESYSYWIETSRVMSFAQLLDFTAHINGRFIYEHSDWFDFLRRKIGPAWVAA